MSLARALEHDFLAVTEKAACAAASTMGYGDRRHSTRMATEAMRAALDEIQVAARVVIGEEERGTAPTFVVGAEVGAAVGQEDALEIDIAVEPLEGARLCATGATGALSVLAASERGGLLRMPDTYMEKIVVGPSARGRIHIDAPVPENLRNIAQAFRREVSDLTVVVLERERHRQLVADIRDAGARIRLIPDGDLAAGIAAALRGTGVHAVMGIGRAPEGVLTAAALRCLGGEIQSRLVALEDKEEKRLQGLGFDDLQKVYRTEDLAPGRSILFSTTGVTDGEFLRGVRFFGGGVRTSTAFLAVPGRTVRFIDTVRLDDPSKPVRFH